MIARSRVYKAFPGVEDISNADGSANVQLVAARIAGGQRPEPRPAACPKVLLQLMQACWVHDPVKRPTAPDLLEVIKQIRAVDGALELLAEPEPELEPEPEPELTYDEFLAQLSLSDKKDDLAEYLEVGNELRDLKQMEEDDLNDDILEDGDLDLDDDTKTRFREAVARLKLAAATSEIQAGGAVTEPERGNIAHADGNDLLRALQRDLGRRYAGIDSLRRSQSAALLDDEVERLRDQTQRDAVGLVEKDLTIAKKDAELAAKDDELAQLRVALERLEGVPPQ
jgi:hypothetical protein